ncbi:VOC family protein [Saccharopolyspora karakumensis]|uniref:VOC family protein n=1 Tax=Saccharopolyspora karakumensis TaxID=2530386 RepID=A0A4R5BB49_9PSEU|nr:VOC family protein [Saccharopolyspora karakumensis]TDD83648.1 VOC family protein [Saccharopolyspora karakumensis]
MYEFTQKITPNLWFDSEAEDAAKFYCSVFPDSRIVHVLHNGEAGPGEQGGVLVVQFELAGLTLVAINGGPVFKLSEAFSLEVTCETQEEIDRLWEVLGEGGEYQPCGWLKDRFGLSWQITPRRLLELITSSDPAVAERAMKKMFEMRKFDIAELEAAALG